MTSAGRIAIVTDARRRDATNDLEDLLLVYAQRSYVPRDQVAFRALIGPRGRLGHISAACFLLYQSSKEGESSVSHLLGEVAPVLMPQLSRTTQPQRTILDGRARGRIDWSSTYKARFAADSNPGRFVCIQSARDFDRPENQLLKFVLRRIQVSMDQVLPGLQRWRAWGPVWREARGQSPMLGDCLTDLIQRAHRFSSHVYLRDVSLPEKIEGHHLLAARRSKNPAYLAVASVYQLYEDVVEVPRWARWSEVVAQAVPLPPAAEHVGSLLAM